MTMLTTNKRRPRRKRLAINAGRIDRLDPSRTLTLRRQWERETAQRFDMLRREITHLIVVEDSLGLREQRLVTHGESYFKSCPRDDEGHCKPGGDLDESLLSGTQNTRWKFHSAEGKVHAFLSWLRVRMATILVGHPSDENHWWHRYIVEGWRKGAGRAFDDTRPQVKAWQATPEAREKLPWYSNQTREQFLRDSFNWPVSREKVQLLASRTFTDLKGVTDATAARIAHTLVDGLTRGDNPREIGRALAKEVNVSKARAQTIARTEIIRTHAEGQLAAFDQMGVTHVGVAAEWATAGDARVCPKCRPLNGVVMRVDEARGLLPRHPNCRCAWLPANVGEDDAGKQKKSKSAIQKAIDDSYRAGLAKGQSLEEQKKIDPWGAADKTIDKDRPRSIFNEEGDGMIGSDLQGKIDKLIVRSKLKTIFNAESYFATCERDKAGHCLPSGETDDHPTPKLPNPSDVTVIKNLPGSTHPKLVVDEVNGHQWVMKFGQSEERLRNEASADAAYRAAGIDTPHSGIVGSGSDTTKFSAYDKDANQDYGEWKSGRSPDEIQEMRKKIGKGFVMDCLLANWDVIGLSNDNILIKNGEPFRVDNGGALLYRALGAPKGDKFGSKVMELETMRNSSTNPTAADVFKHLTDDDIVKQIKDVVIHKDAILQSIHDDATAKIVAKRIGSLVDWANSKSKPTAAKPAAEPTASIPQASTSDHGIKSGFDLHVYVQTHKYAKSGYAPKYVDKFLPDKYVKALSDLNPDGIKDGMMRLPGTTVNRFNILKKIMPKGTVLVVPKPAKWTAVKKGVMVITPEGTSITTKADHPGEKVKGSTGVTHGKDLGKMSTAPDLTSGHIKWTHSLSSSQKYAVQNWKDVAALIRKTVADAAAKGVPLDHDSHAYHFVEALKKCPKYAGNLYRGINSKDYAQSIISQCMSAGIGGTWADVSPMGMSRKPDTSLDFAQGGLLLRVKAKTARPIELSDGHTNEAEVIGMPGTQYRILGIHHDAKVSGRYSPITVIELEEVK